MSIQVIVPPELVIRQDSWRLPDPRIFQRSEFTGRSRELFLGVAPRWTCEAEIVTRTTAELYPARGFVASMMLPGAYCILPMYPAGGQLTGFAGQVTGPFQVNGAGQLGLDLNIKGLPLYTVQGKAGFIVTFGDEAQVGVLRVDLLDDGLGGVGAGVMQLSRPMRQSPANNSPVFVRFPFARMRLINGLAWQNALYQLHELPPLQFEENF